jgi:hypothetical protein
MFLKFFDDPAAAARFAGAVPANRWSPAQLQERLLKAASVDEALRLFPEHDDVALLRVA